MQGAARRQAIFCLATGISPSEYKKLTLVEFTQFAEQLERLNKQ